METYNAAGFPCVAAGAESGGSDFVNEDELRKSDSEDSNYFDMSHGKHKRPSAVSASGKSNKPPTPPLQKAAVILLAKLKQQNATEEVSETEKRNMARIMKCRDRSSSLSTPKVEAKRALVMAAKLM